MIETAPPLDVPRLDSPIGGPISFVELFLIDSGAAGRTGSAVPESGWSAVNELWLRLYSGGSSGWSRCAIPADRRFDLSHWASVFFSWRGLTVSQCLDYVRSREAVWGAERSDLAASALLDLAYRRSRPFAAQTHSSFEPNSEVLFDRSQAYCCYALTV